MLRTKNRMRLCSALLTMNLLFIWGNSLMPGTVSGAISDWVKEFLSLFLNFSDDGGGSGFWIRKLAHFSEFAALGMCLGWLFAMKNKRWILPAFWGVAAACVDETIQCFVPGRGPGIRDVCIDAGGVLTGLLLLHGAHMLYCKLWRKQT